MECETSRPNVPIHTRSLSPFPKVNPMTGEYIEEACDLVVAGSTPLSARRFYNHMAPPTCLYGNWRMNPESLIKANFENQELPQNVAIGQQEGGCILLDGRRSAGYAFNPHSQLSYTNLGEDLPSAQTNPCNMSLTYTKANDRKVAKRFQFLGEIIDGTGKKTHFWTHFYTWHNRLRNKKRDLRRNPESWTPYYCMVSKEELPNGNYLEYGYKTFLDDEYYPTHYRLEDVKAYNKKGKKLNALSFEYPAAGDKTLQIRAKSEDGRLSLCRIKYQSIFKGEMWIHGRRMELEEQGFLYISDVQSAFSPKISYTYDGLMRIVQIAKPEGRLFQTGYSPEGRVASQLASVGPNGEMLPIAKYSYHGNTTHLRDGEGNLTVFHFDHSKIACIEKFHSDDTLFGREQFFWDDKGQLTKKSIADASQILLATTYVYDSKGNVLEETLTDGKDSYTLYRTYSNDQFNLKVSETDGYGKTTLYEYVPGTNLLQAELVYEADTLKKRTLHTYDDSAICIKTVVDDGTANYCRITTIKPRYASVCYGLPEIVEEKTLDSGQEILLHKTVYDYEPSGQIRSEQHFDSNGDHLYTLQKCYDKCERLILENDAHGTETKYTYDANFNRLSQTGPHPTTWTYDKANRPISENQEGVISHIRYDTLGRVIAKIDPSGNETGYRYNALGHLTETTYPDGGIEKKAYDFLGRVIKETDPKGYETHYTYHFRGEPTLITYPDGTQESFTYHPNGTLLEHIDKNGTKTVYSYDIFQRPIKEETLLKTTSATYNSFCKLSETDPEGVTTFYAYDSAGRKISEKILERETFYAYDSLGRLYRTSQEDSVHFETYDLLNHVIEKRTEDLLGNILFQENYAYDPAGNRTHIITCEGVSETGFNTRNLPIYEISPDGQRTNISYGYGGGWYAKHTQDPLGVIKREHHYRGRLHNIQIKTPEDAFLQYRGFEFDLNGNQIKGIEWVYEGLNMSKTITNTWEYGPLNRLEKLVESDMKETRYLYSKGKLETLIKPDKNEIHHSYDEYGRLARLTAKDIDYHYTYDLNDQALEVFDAINQTATTRTYDAYGNLTQEKLANGLILKSTYNLSGQRTKLAYPDGSQAHFNYNASNLSQISYEEHAYSYIHNLSGKPTTKGFQEIEYDSCLRWKNMRAPCYWATYSYDPRGNLLRCQFADALGEIEANFAYDYLNQLTSENEHEYVYNSHYQRLVKDDCRYIHNDLSQVLSDGKTAYDYDQNGNLSHTEETELLYDSLDRLIEVRKQGKQYQYFYDPFNRRLTKKTPQETIHYLWDGRNEIGSTKGELRVLGEGLAEMGTAFIKLGKEVFIPIHDQRGAIVKLLDTQSKTRETIRYTAFGEETTETRFCPWRFASKRLDEETGYVYFGRRYYCSSLGKWITTDPRGLAEGPNLYAYVSNCPLSALDLYGEWALWQNVKGAFGKGAEFAFPCANGLYNLPAEAPMWQRGALAAGAVFEILSLALPPARALLPLAERGALHLGKMAMSKIAEKTLLQEVEKTAAIALEKKIVCSTIGKSRAKAFTHRNYRKNLIQRTGVDPGKTVHAHHVFPQAFIDKFAKKGINVHDPKFCTWWEGFSHSRSAQAYNSKWASYLETNPTQTEIFNYGVEIMKEYGKPVGF